MSDEMVWQCRGCDNYNCLHSDYCNKCRGIKQYLNLNTFAVQPHVPPPLVEEPLNEDTEDEVEVAAPAPIIPEPSPPVSNNIISSSNIIIQEASSASSPPLVGGRMFSCDVCNEHFITRNKLYYHKKKKHISSEDRIKCAHCNVHYQKKSTYALQKHLEKIHLLAPAEAIRLTNEAVQVRPEPEPEVPTLEPQQQMRLSVTNVSNGHKSSLRIRDINGLISIILRHMDRKYQSKGKLYKSNEELNISHSINNVLVDADEIEYRII